MTRAQSDVREWRGGRVRAEQAHRADANKTARLMRSLRLAELRWPEILQCLSAS